MEQSIIMLTCCLVVATSITCFHIFLISQHFSVMSGKSEDNEDDSKTVSEMHRPTFKSHSVFTMCKRFEVVKRW